VLRDPTRGGLASALNEIAQASGVGIVLQVLGPEVVTFKDGKVLNYL